MKRLGPVLLAVSLVCLTVGAFALRQRGSLFVSPDETAVRFFAAAYAETGSLAVPEPLNLAFGGAIHPRSVLSVAGRLVPGSFFGLPLILGAVAALFGAWSIPFVPILLSALGVLAFACVCRRLFGDRIGWLSGAFLAVMPAWWYYTARSLMPNVPFMALVGGALAFLLVRPFRLFLTQTLSCNQERDGTFRKRPHSTLVEGVRGRIGEAADGFLAGACIGAALFVRASEALWLGVIVFAVLLWQRRALRWRGFVGLVFGLVLVLSPMPFLNDQLYGSPWATGYTAARDASGADDPSVFTETRFTGVSSAPAWWRSLEEALKPAFPFGIHPRLAARQFAAYGLGMFWWEWVLVASGIWHLASGRKKKTSVSDSNYQLPTTNYLALCIVVSLWLVLMYGSWTFTDNPDPTQITIGNSHVRYWLPIFVLWLPFAAVAVDAFVRWVSTRLPLLRRGLARRAAYARGGRGESWMLVAVWLVWLALGARSAFFTPQDGLLAEARVLAESRAIHDAVMALTPPDAVIVVDRADKLFFPNRAVRYPLRDAETYVLIPEIAFRVPTYYYGITLPPQDLAFINEVKLAGSPFVFFPVRSFGIETLYHVFNQTEGRSPY